MTTAKSVLITGATRGLGENLARQFASRGYRLALTGRKQADLDRLAAELAGKSPGIVVETLDVTDYGSIAPVIERCAERLGGLDIIVVNAGVAFVTPVGKGHLDLVRQTIDVNLTGAIATAEAAVELFRRQGHGQVVGISSIAGVRGMRNNGVYCATKAGFSRYLEALRLETRRHSIVVTDLAPGYIDTELNRAIPNRPFVVTAEKGTRIMVDLIERKVSFRYVPPWPWTLVAQVLKWLPDSVIAKM
ncbi:MAG: SDR family oxidoreductase [Gammaproteobacteria bacterium]|nr:SDR family oxidoreductase [Gammaproteobacteria bacterium]